jgi:hypothetical protein
VRKLYALVSGKIINDDSDSLANHEVMMRGHFAACRMQHVRRLATQVMLPGHLIGAFVKEKLQDMLETLKLQVGAPDPTRPVEGGRSHLCESAAAWPGAVHAGTHTGEGNMARSNVHHTVYNMQRTQRARLARLCHAIMPLRTLRSS